MNLNSKQSSIFTHFHPNIKLLLKIVLFNMVILSISRAVFLIEYYGIFKEASFGSILYALIHGLRFDLSTIFIINTLPFLFFFLPWKWFISKTFHSILKIYLFISFSIQSFFLIADIEYYSFVNRHLAAEITNLNNDILPVVNMIFSDYLFQLVLFIVIVLSLWFIIKKIFKKDTVDNYEAANIKTALSSRITKSVIHILFLISFSVLFIRGGLQSKPLRISYAFTDDNIALGHLTLNGIYTLINSIYKPGISIDIPYDYDSAVVTVRKILKDKSSKFINNSYPLLRETTSDKNKEELYNIVIIIMESWSSDSVGVQGGKYNITPNFDKLAKEGLFFSNFFSVGQRSIDAPVSILYSLPSFISCTIIGKSYEQNQMIGIGHILKKKGYSTLFICGANRGSMGLDAFSAKAGFDRYIAKDNFDLPIESFDGTWGVYDEYAFKRANEEFSKLHKPFLGVIYTLNPHAPYKIPSAKFNKVKGEKHSDFLNAMYYSDWAVGNFFDLAKKTDYFKNTLFVLVADHPEGHHEKSIYDLFRIPCLFYFPGKIPQGIDEQVGSQLDIFPSIMNFMGINYTHSSFGKNLFNSENRSALISYGSNYGLFKNDFLLLHTIDKPIGFYNFKTDRMLKKNLVKEYVSQEEEYSKELLSMLKVTTTLLKNNRIAILENTKKNVK